MALIVAIPLCCCGVTLSVSPNIEPISSCCSSNTSDENSPCEEGQCPCLEHSNQTAEFFEPLLPLTSKLKCIQAEKITGLVEIPSLREQLVFYGVKRPPPPEPAFTELYSIYRL